MSSKKLNVHDYAVLYLNAAIWIATSISFFPWFPLIKPVVDCIETELSKKRILMFLAFIQSSRIKILKS